MKRDFKTIDTLYNSYPMKEIDEVCRDMQITPKELLDESVRLRIFPKGAITCEEEKLIRDYGDSIHTAVVFLLENRTVAEVSALLP